MASIIPATIAAIQNITITQMMAIIIITTGVDGMIAARAGTIATTVVIGATTIVIGADGGTKNHY